jgi:ubiquinone/menaquinone biosynthesis C-methylase UbiE
MDTYIQDLAREIKKTPLQDKLQSGELVIEEADARHLKYSDNSFDRVLSISTFEHFPDDGDIEGMQEVYRVLKPGGIAVITVEGALSFHEHWSAMPFYIGYQYNQDEQSPEAPHSEHIFKQNSVGFYRFYDRKAVLERLVNPAGFELVNLSYLAEKHPLRRHFEPACPTWKRRLLTHFASVVALFSLKLHNENDLPHCSEGIIPILILRKP